MRNAAYRSRIAYFFVVACLLCFSLFQGAVFFAVCRGKVSEGLDFADRAGRAVIVTGLPYPAFKDAKVRLKRKFLDEAPKVAGIQQLSGDQWYNQQAARAINQAVGRVIRHRKDYGAIILADARFSNPAVQKQLSRWIRPYVSNFSNFGTFAGSLARFFNHASSAYPEGARSSRAESERNTAAAAAAAPSALTARNSRTHGQAPQPQQQRGAGRIVAGSPPNALAPMMLEKLLT